VLAVTASGPDGQKAIYADGGSFVDLMFPGTELVNYDGGLFQVVGTSTATATAAGTIIGTANQNNISLPQAIANVRQKYPFR
jgi:hypothetical protein